jgi:hypothetical protein
MRPKISMWSDYGAPTRKHWRVPSRRYGRTSIGPKILVAAVVVVAGVIGISGIYPQVIDAEWVQGGGTHPPKMPVKTPDASAANATAPRRSGIVAAIPLPPRRGAVTTGEATVATPRLAASAPAPAPELTELRTSVALAAEPPSAPTAAPLGLADIPDAQASANVEAPADAAPVAAKPVVTASRGPVVVKRKVVRTEHHRSNGSSGAYAQWGGGGWGGFPFFGGGNFRRF